MGFFFFILIPLCRPIRFIFIHVLRINCKGLGKGGAKRHRKGKVQVRKVLNSKFQPSVPQGILQGTLYGLFGV